MNRFDYMLTNNLVPKYVDLNKRDGYANSYLNWLATNTNSYDFPKWTWSNLCDYIELTNGFSHNFNGTNFILWPRRVDLLERRKVLEVLIWSEGEKHANAVKGKYDTGGITQPTPTWPQVKWWTDNYPNDYDYTSVGREYCGLMKHIWVNLYWSAGTKYAGAEHYWSEFELDANARTNSRQSEIDWYIEILSNRSSNVAGDLIVQGLLNEENNFWALSDNPLDADDIYVVNTHDYYTNQPFASVNTGWQIYTTAVKQIHNDYATNWMGNTNVINYNYLAWPDVEPVYDTNTAYYTEMSRGFWVGDSDLGETIKLWTNFPCLVRWDVTNGFLYVKTDATNVPASVVVTFTGSLVVDGIGTWSGETLTVPQDFSKQNYYYLYINTAKEISVEKVGGVWVTSINYTPVDPPNYYVITHWQSSGLIGVYSFSSRELDIFHAHDNVTGVTVAEP